MLSKKNYTIIGLTTFNTEFLRISVPALARLKQKAYLILHNDNPDRTVTKSQIRRLGYDGPLHIINTMENSGQMQARLNILSAIEKLGIKSDWMVFANDDDLLLDVDVPPVAESNFAVMQNMVFVKRRLLDLLRIMDNPENYTVDGTNITIERPNIGIVGTMLRTGIMIDLGKKIERIIKQIRNIDATLDIQPPEDVVMWIYLQMYAKHLDPDAEPIYMDKTNYIAVALDTVPPKHNRPAEYYEKTMQKYCDLMAALLDAAPLGL